jgi:hypothetical protein
MERKRREKKGERRKVARQHAADIYSPFFLFSLSLPEYRDFTGAVGNLLDRLCVQNNSYCTAQELCCSESLLVWKKIE